MAPELVYVPPPGLETNFDIFRRRVNSELGLSLQDYHDLHEFSIGRPNDFWMALWRFMEIKASVHPTRAVDESLRIDQFPPFFENARLNYAENLLSRTDAGVAIKYLSEENLASLREVTWKELNENVRILSDAMRASNISRGDVVCIIGGSSPESLALFLAIASVGAIVSAFATDAGERVLLDRMGQVCPKIVFAESSYQYNGKRHLISDRVTKIFSLIEKGSGAEVICTSGTVPYGWVPIEEFRQRATGRPLSFDQVPFNHPLLIAFSSGTTGTPKGIVHSHGGMVVNGKKESLLHKNFGPDDVHYHYAGIGWVLWNIMISAMLCGTTVVLYNGSPFYPTPEKQLAAVLGAGVTAWGAGPRYFSELQKTGVNPKPYVKNLKCILSAGAILTESQSKWLKEAFGPVCQMSFSGGTELCGNFLAGHIGMPGYAGEMTVKELGTDIDVFTPDGRPAKPGESGELVCKRPFPNMPVKFWNDPGKKRYADSYFSTFPGVWRHGDFIRMNPETTGWVILGRSDGVLNPSGVRFGSGEIYSIMEQKFHDKVADSICVGQQRAWDESERVFLFIKGTKGSNIGSLEREIRAQIARDLSRRHVPQFLFWVQEIPYNANNKKLEIPLKKVLSEGRAAMAKLTCPAEEKSVLMQYLPFYEVEKLVGTETSSLSPRL
ncbi:acetoacetate-CoA ligase [Cladophialophora bantiana CBS 173.52]|uniref:Acetoacetate-CoA ligase n=1 Tax=Cladophialophora bantiana (strain ATCC 10958 / CBS 173.52 / CDC B-1940 / NIH 8579) TaxID=1442370 RepID=A0A0D2ES85_CLAB1|nr:acetoacetate-CoA ligase [Cladophialophora bantiana CBS 173.52]KIW92761.1 acetoacetate-CoA ligase [Cladophialophora bantiana CBS 173.52]